ncbi:nucleotide triphosphate diphosphatase NUDT15 [Nucisporomicrobium flavum]|uniref:nucleotide triphosphate diphosphatase NUDT15 n=1 Tax=Nucisporomicrobium flavum TaxID=2785915 RepID=UPI003C2B4B74
MTDGIRPPGVGMVVLRPGGEVLLGYRTKSGETPTWCLPGGSLEPGETFAAAAVRETAEEAGLTPAGPRAFAIAIDLAVGAVTAGVVAEHAGGSPQVREPHVFERWQWWPPAALPAPLFPASAAVLAVWCDSAVPDGWSVHRLTG